MSAARSPGRWFAETGSGRTGLVLRQLRSAKRRYRAITVETRSPSMTAVVKTTGPIPDGKLHVGAAKEVHDMNWKQRVLEAAAGIVLIALPVHAQQVGPTDRDERVVSFIHQANLHEIAAANLAKTKSSSQDVKDFADQMITDHQSADDQLRSYAQAHKIDLDGLRRHLDGRGQSTARGRARVGGPGHGDRRVGVHLGERERGEA